MIDREGLRLEHVESGAAEAPLLERPQEGFLIHQRAPPDVQENRPLGEGGDLRPPDHPPRLGAQQNPEEENIGRAEDLLAARNHGVTFLLLVVGWRSNKADMVLAWEL